MIRNITLIRVEFEIITGFHFTILGLELDNFEGELFGFAYQLGKWMYLDILFFRFEITRPWY